MVWDLRGALLKKQEVESARLAEFEFRLRARTMKLLAPQLDCGIDAADLISQIALHGDAAIIDRIAAQCTTVDPPMLQRLFDASRAQARAQLVDEIGDPAPYRLA